MFLNTTLIEQDVSVSISQQIRIAIGTIQEYVMMLTITLENWNTQEQCFSSVWFPEYVQDFTIIQDNVILSNFIICNNSIQHRSVTYQHCGHKLGI